MGSLNRVEQTWVWTPGFEFPHLNLGSFSLPTVVIWVRFAVDSSFRDFQILFEKKNAKTKDVVGHIWLYRKHRRLVVVIAWCYHVIKVASVCDYLAVQHMYQKVLFTSNLIFFYSNPKSYGKSQNFVKTLDKLSVLRKPTQVHNVLCLLWLRIRFSELVSKPVEWYCDWD